MQDYNKNSPIIRVLIGESISTTATSFTTPLPTKTTSQPTKTPLQDHISILSISGAVIASIIVVITICAYKQSSKFRAFIQRLLNRLEKAATSASSVAATSLTNSAISASSAALSSLANSVASTRPSTSSTTASSSDLSSAVISAISSALSSALNATGTTQPPPLSSEITPSTTLSAFTTDQPLSSILPPSIHSCLSAASISNHQSSSTADKLNITFIKATSLSQPDLSKKPPIPNKDPLTVRHKCSLGCKYETSNSRNLSQHEANHKKSLERQFKCDKCSFYALNNQGKAAHLRACH